MIRMSPADITRASYDNESCRNDSWSKVNLGRYEFQKMGRIGSTEMYLIWEWFGPTINSGGLTIITGSNKRVKIKEPW